MILALVDGPRVLCGRPGCAKLPMTYLAGRDPGNMGVLGTMDLWGGAGWTLGLSRHWYKVASEPVRWRKGSHHRRHSRLASPGVDAPAKVLGGKRGFRWQVPLPTVIECPRCRTVQSVVKPLTDGPA